MFKGILFCALFVAAFGCAEEKDSKTSVSNMLYICYTNATCDGVTVNQTHEVCATASQGDLLQTGDRMVEDWKLIWKASCSQDEGIVTDRADREVGQLCLNTSDGSQATWGCEARCYPQYRECN